MIRKTFDIEVTDKRDNGGRIVINTGGVDRDRDRVLPSGARLESYLANPVVQWGHNYREPWATIGRTNSLEVTDDRIVADFELRPPANEHDPQNVVLLLWNGGWVRTASIGFDPRPVAGITADAAGWTENDAGGYDYTSWELLEWSLVPIPANQEALRLAVKAMGETDVRRADASDGSYAWVRKLTVESDVGRQVLFAIFRSFQITVPEDATKVDIDDDGNFVEIPDPDAGKTRDLKEVCFVPPIVYTSERWGEDATYTISGLSKPDDQIVEPWRDEWNVEDLSGVLLSLPMSKGTRRRQHSFPLGVCRLTKATVEHAKASLLGDSRSPRRRVKVAIPYKRYPLADRDEAWDGPAQVAAADTETLYQICAWYDSEYPDLKSAYKLPHHEAAGEHRTVWRGVVAAMGALLGARGGANIPDADRRGVYNHLAMHYRDFDAEPPEFKAAGDGDVVTQTTPPEWTDATPSAGAEPELVSKADGESENIEPNTDAGQDGEGEITLPPDEADALADAIGNWLETITTYFTGGN